jgi:transposase
LDAAKTLPCPECRLHEFAGVPNETPQPRTEVSTFRVSPRVYICGPYGIVERTFAWLGRNRRFSKDYEYRVQTSETMIDIAAIRLMLNRIVPT